MIQFYSDTPRLIRNATHQIIVNNGRMDIVAVAIYRTS